MSGDKIVKSYVIPIARSGFITNNLLIDIELIIIINGSKYLKDVLILIV